jgi:hypothetical protein
MIFLLFFLSCVISKTCNHIDLSDDIMLCTRGLKNNPLVCACLSTLSTCNYMIVKLQMS